MKHCIASFIVVLLYAAPLLSQPIQFERTAHDFGKIYEQGGPATYQFKFKNVSAQPVTISRVNASCGCTTPDWTKESIPPGGEGFIKAEYNPLGRPGPFEKYLIVQLENAPGNVELMIKGEVLPGTGKVRPKPATYTKTFTYNRVDIAKDEQDFKQLIDRLADLLTNHGNATVTIESSASKVPTKAFDNNEQLAATRAQEAEMRLLEALKKRGISSNNLKINPHITLVQGPDYNNDFKENRAAYEKFQYVKITVE